MSETPRTDKILSEQAFTDLDGAVDVLNQWVDFARQLERELATMTQQVAFERNRANAINDRFQSSMDNSDRIASEWMHACRRAEAQLAKRDAEIAALKGHAVEPRIGLNSDGSLDEVVGSPGHIEQLDSGHWFVEIGEYAIWLHAKGKIVAHYEHRAAYPKE